MHEKVGSQRVGCIPGRHWKRGAYRDLVILALDREEFSSRWARPGAGLT